MGYAVLIQAALELDRAGRSISASEIGSEIARVSRAVDAASKELANIQIEAEAKVGIEEAAIFGAQILMLSDPGLLEAIRAAIENDLVSAERAVVVAGEEQARILEGLDDAYLASRAMDVRDVAKRLVRCLLGVTNRGIPGDLKEDSIMVADDLLPSETVMIDATKVVGIVLDKGGATSHTAILARSLGIPAVVGTGNATAMIKQGDALCVDGETGEVKINPDVAEQRQYGAKVEAWLESTRSLSLLKDLPAITVDGRHIELAANIGGIKDAEEAKKAGAEGVGLFRTEFLFIDRGSTPSEDEQFEVYRDVLSTLAPRPVVIRTLDAGGDKDIPYLDLPKEENPFLGLRAIRLCLREKGLFRTQLRALLRASVYGNPRIMFPMIASLAELREAKGEYQAARNALIEEGVPVANTIQVGIMIEVPSAAMDADILAPECDFFSIGTNDLVQYTMACDRGNSAIAYLSDPFYPAVLRLIHRTIEEGHKQGIWVGMCGEMAGMPHAVPLLVGMGIDELSMAANSVPRAKQIVRGLDYASAQRIWGNLKGLSTNTEIKNYLKTLL
jgi:phosphotransferase system enzyme I (PtsI)